MDRWLTLMLLGPVALIPLLAVGVRQTRPDAGGIWVGVAIGAGRIWFWAALAVAAAGLAGGAVALNRAGWRSDLGATLWLSALSCLALYAGLSAVRAPAGRLAILAGPYLLGLVVLSTVLSGGASSIEAPASAIWLWVHIVTALATYGAITVAALAGVGALVKESAIKSKRDNALARALPSVTDGEALQIAMLRVAAGVLAAGLVTGMAAQFSETRSLVAFEHKSLFSLIAFAVIVVLLAAHRRMGLHGRRIAKFGLLAFLLLTLAYPGVKFVAQILIGES